MPKRIYSLDVLRGIAIAAMLFLDAPPEKIYPLLEHAPWQGLTVTDLAFPLFAFAMGTSAAISMSRSEPSTRRILRRVIVLFALGFFLNVLTSICSGEIFFDQLRLFGILQRLAITYAAAIFIVKIFRHERGILIAAFMLLIVSSAGFHLYAPENSFDETHNISGAVDLIFPGANHIYTPTHDPEGLYGTLAGTASVLFGFLAGKILLDNSTSRKKIFLLATVGGALLIAGGLWTNFDIVSKKLWTAPFALINAGIDLIFLALLVKFVDNSSSKKFFHPFGALGKNPLFFFMANNVALIILFAIKCDGTDFYLWLYQHTTQGIFSPEFGATLFCVLWCLLWFLPAEIFSKLNITIKL